MAVTNFTPLLGLALPTTGDLSGTWGTTVNDAITTLLDTAVAGTTTLSSDADVTLSTTNGATNQARSAVILWTASGTVTRNITAPAQSKAYVVINATGSTQSIVVRGVGPTTGVTIVAGEKALVAWNGSDFVKVSSSIVNLASVTGTLGATNGGTGLASPGTSGNFLQSNGTGWTSASTLGVANGGTNGSATPTAGAVAYGTGTAYGFTSAGTSGQVLQSNGTSAPSWTSVGLSGLTGMQVFTSSGTFTIPTGKTVVKVTVVGAGGGSGGGGSTGASGGGGGGATAITYLTSLTPGNTITVTVGTGGAGGTSGGAGSAGGSSSISSGTQTISTVTANGGSGSNGGTSVGAAGGSASGGTLNLSGGAGTYGFLYNGSGINNNQGPGFGGTSTASPTYGGGGNGTAANSGSNGAGGVVFFEY